jgi:hypothetical protein
MKKYLLVLLLVVFIIPSVAFASWWNPFSWNWFGMFSRNNNIPQTEQTDNTTIQTSQDNSVQPTQTQPTAQGTVFSNQYLSINILPGWVAKQPSSVPQSVNITKGNYILYINPLFGHASGIEGGRFGEVAGGMPSVDAVVTNQAMADGYTCALMPYEQLKITDKLSLGSLYTGISQGTDEAKECNFPSDGKSAWFGAYSSGSASDVFGRTTSPDAFNEYAITVAYNTNDVNKLPKADSKEVGSTLYDISVMLDSLKLKTITTPASATLKTYTDNSNGFSFQYPEDYKIGKDVGGGYIPVQTYFTSGGNTIITADMPNTYPKNTDFSDAFFSVAVNNQLSAQDCEKNYDYATSGKTLTNAKVINGITFYAGDASGVAMGHQMSDSFYNTYYNGTCYELIEGLRTAGMGMIDSITQGVDGGDVFNKLDNILNTFKFTK